MRNSKRFWIPFPLVFLLWFCIFVNTGGSEVKPAQAEAPRDELAKVESELEEKRRELERLNQIEELTFSELLDLEEYSSLTERLIGRLASRQMRVERELQAKGRSQRETDSTLCRHRENAERRLREAHKSSRRGSPAAMLAAPHQVDLGRGRRLLRTILTQDQQILTEAEALRAELKERRQNLSRVKPELSCLRRRKHQEQAGHLEELQDKERLLGRIASEKRLCTQAIQHLEKEALKLRQILGRHPGEKAGDETVASEESGWFERMRGKLPWPIQGRVITAFGEQRDRRFHTTTENRGIEIQAKDRSQVLAVAGGKVVYSAKLRGYGKVVLVEHAAGYYTLYARMSEISVSPGDDVRRLQRIGLAGEDTSTTPSLHFEIRKGKESLDPLEWLR